MFENKKKTKKNPLQSLLFFNFRACELAKMELKICLFSVHSTYAVLCRLHFNRKNRWQ